ncbi:MAG: indolepyruvate oxidoreductase subunit beta [Lachnospiraceae bacterium]|jgi:indolepyruvate ferredoxin oxidoreductase beta subunit|nr:indolepyruvate oxidoreductase subunit beta [Lachnospiraceae bacterium]
METKNIMIVGVGGQGTLLTSRVLGNLAEEAGYDVKISEVHGMAQRGGSVVTYVRFGDKVEEPIVEEGMADVIIAFERLEALRYFHYLKKGGSIILNDQRIDPMPVVIGAAKYPEGIIEELKSKVDLHVVDAMSEAKKLGNSRVFNMIVLGMAAHYMSFPTEMWKKVIQKTVPHKTIDLNLKAFDVGYSLVK